MLLSAPDFYHARICEDELLLATQHSETEIPEVWEGATRTEKGHHRFVNLDVLNALSLLARRTRRDRTEG